MKIDKTSLGLLIMTIVVGVGWIVIKNTAQATEYTDNFDTDPYALPRWVNELGTATWDSVDLELELNDDNSSSYRYVAGSPGSIGHEAQVTARAETGKRLVGPGVRFDNTGVNDMYGITFENASGNISYIFTRWNNGVRTNMKSGTIASAFTPGNFYTIRMSASGGVGGEVVLDVWFVDHGATKPSDPGWIGDDNNPDATFTDTEPSGTRLDGSQYTHAGIAGRGTTGAHEDRHDYFKVRDISDRAGANVPPVNIRGGTTIRGGVNFR